MNLDQFIFGNDPPETPQARNLEQNLDRYFTKLRSILNKGLNFSDNFNGYVTTVTTNSTPGSETVITHNLRRTPVGCLVLEKDKAAHIFLGASGKDANNYYIQSDVASVTATLIII